MRRITLLLSILCLALWLSACSSTASTGSSTPTPVNSTSATPTITQPTPTVAPPTPTAIANQTGVAPTAVAQAYYQALKNKDYNKAYTYLSTDAATTQGQKLGQAAFVALAQSRDQEWGPIQSYDSQLDTSDPTMVIMTVSRTQNQRYHSHLQIKKGKIVSLDNI